MPGVLTDIWPPAWECDICLQFGMLSVLDYPLYAGSTALNMLCYCLAHRTDHHPACTDIHLTLQHTIGQCSALTIIQSCARRGAQQDHGRQDGEGSQGKAARGAVILEGVGCCTCKLTECSTWNKYAALHPAVHTRKSHSIAKEPRDHTLAALRCICLQHG